MAGFSVLKAALFAAERECLHEVFPFTAPVSLRERKTTIGCGDRLGLATAGHLRAAAKYDIAPVLAQQSIRELTLTGPDFPGVVADVTFLVFQEGYDRGYGADGDHLKTIQDIDAALAAGMPMITLDLSDVMSAEPALWNAGRVEEQFGKLGADVRSHVLDGYADKTFRAGKLDNPVHRAGSQALRADVPSSPRLLTGSGQPYPGQAGGPVRPGNQHR